MRRFVNRCRHLQVVRICAESASQGPSPKGRSGAARNGREPGRSTTRSTDTQRWERPLTSHSPAIAPQYAVVLFVTGVHAVD